MSRFVRPDTVTLPLSNGDTITVKKRLNAGEQRARFARMYQAGANGGLTVDPMQVGMPIITAYLVDWTFTDDAGRKVPIAGVSADDLTSVIDSLDVDSFREIRMAIEAHEAAQVAESEDAKKKTRTGANGSEATSPSPSVSAGTSPGSVN